jgi:hypothetical protein
LTNAEISFREQVVFSVFLIGLFVVTLIISVYYVVSELQHVAEMNKKSKRIFAASNALGSSTVTTAKDGVAGNAMSTGNSPEALELGIVAEGAAEGEEGDEPAEAENNLPAQAPASGGPPGLAQAESSVAPPPPMTDDELLNMMFPDITDDLSDSIAVMPVRSRVKFFQKVKQFKLQHDELLSKY